MICPKVCHWCFFAGTKIIRGEPHDLCSLDGSPTADVDQRMCDHYEKSIPAKQVEAWQLENAKKADKAVTQLALF